MKNKIRKIRPPAVEGKPFPDHLRLGKALEFLYGGNVELRNRILIDIDASVSGHVGKSREITGPVDVEMVCDTGTLNPLSWQVLRRQTQRLCQCRGYMTLQHVMDCVGPEGQILPPKYGRLKRVYVRVRRISPTRGQRARASKTRKRAAGH